MTLAAPQLVHYLLEAGLADRAALVAGDLLVSDASRRHRNFRVHVRGGPGCFVKQAQAGQPLAESSLQREALCAWLIGTQPGLAALRPVVPRYLGYDAARHLLALELLPEAENLSEYQARTGRLPLDLAAACGRMLGQVHRGAADLDDGAEALKTLPRALPWVLSIDTLIAAQFDRLSAANAQVLGLVAQVPGFHAELEALRAGWRREGLIHGDMKWDNLLVLPDSRLAIVDWELADIGEHAWDVGGLLQSWLVSWVASMPDQDEPVADRLVDAATLPLAAMQPALQAFWPAYVEARGTPPGDVAELRRRCVQYAAARMIQTAYEHLSQASAMSRHGLRLLQLSLNILVRPDDAARDLFGFAEAA